ncbi:hypothetical protein CEXT_44941 [Caerostris extrusa]|uniref:Secreted protein n=1 Tax=Caerostris extrusa TaxID=172846 RepID=A0AAV4TQT8_CAEEX|nr:hypothetical protein CEXT_44941 [Caerostris extrusa]
MSWVLGLLLETIANRAALESQRITALVNFSRWHGSWDRVVRIAAISTSNAVPRPTRTKFGGELDMSQVFRGMRRNVQLFLSPCTRVVPVT